MSSAADTGASAKASPVLGSMSGAIFPPTGSTSSPWIKLRNFCISKSPNIAELKLSLSFRTRSGAHILVDRVQVRAGGSRR